MPYGSGHLCVLLQPFVHTIIKQALLSGQIKAVVLLFNLCSFLTKLAVMCLRPALNTAISWRT